MGRDAAARNQAPSTDGASAWMSRWLLPALIFLAALLLRLAPLQRYVTPDEPAWVLRSIQFSQALAARDFAAVPATGHPGVTTMWLGSLGLQIHRWLAPQQAAVHLDWLEGLAGLSPESPVAFSHLAFFLPAGRVLVALVTSLGLVGVFLLARRLWGQSAALLAALLLACDPFLAGHSGLLHLDGLLTTFMTLSALTALLAITPLPAPQSRDRETNVPPPEAAETEVRSIQYRWAAVSGMLAGLAVLTKTPGGFLAPWVVLLLIAAWLTRRISGRQALATLALWALAAGLIFLALYPALWADPIATLRGLLDVGERHVEGALRPIFFHGENTYDPAPTFYGVVWLFRVSPLALIGLPIALVVYLRHPDPRRFDSVALVILALGFGLFITLVGKKHDRYLLPAFPPLTLVAALGWEKAGSLVNRQAFSRISNAPLSNLFIAALVLIQLIFILPYLSTPLGYYNPLVGGPRAALSWLEVGWGEGEGAAARWLNQQPAAKQLIVATSSIPTFAPIFRGQTVPLDQQTRYQADHILYPPLQGVDRNPPGFETEPPVYEKRVGGISYATLIRNPAPGEQAAYLQRHTHAEDLILLDAEAALTRQYDGPAELEVLSDAGDPTQVAARLDVLLPGHERLWYVALPAASPITARQVQHQLACRGEVESSEAVAGATIAQIVVADRQHCTTAQNTEYEKRFGDSLTLIDHFMASEPIAWPDHLTVVVRWGAMALICPGQGCDYRAALHLKDEAGRIWVEGGQEILDADYRRPAAWSPGDWSDQTFRLALPPAIPPGRYRVELGVFDLASGAVLGARKTDGGFAGLSVSLGTVTIAPPTHPPTPWDMVIPERFEPPLAAGPLALLGQDPPPQQVPSGEKANFDLFWQATTDPAVDYALRWSLSPVEGDVVVTETVPLSPHPTTRWRAQELEQVRYDLPIPPDLPAGDYALSINVLDGAGKALWTRDQALAPLEILARDRLFTLPSDIAHPLDLTLGGVVHLRGFDIDRLSAAPGDQLPLTLYWQADGPTDLSYTVFVHLVGPDGMIYGQVDRPPADGAAPTSSWASGQVVIDALSLPVRVDAPSGTYHVVVGLYDPYSADRLPVYDAQGAELPNGQIALPVEVTVK